MNTRTVLVPIDVVNKLGQIAKAATSLLALLDEGWGINGGICSADLATLKTLTADPEVKVLVEALDRLEQKKKAAATPHKRRKL